MCRCARNPHKSRPKCAAVDTASELGADTPTTAETPAARAFCTISKLVRPPHREHRAARRQPVIEQRPTDDFVDGVVPSDVFTHHAEARAGIRDARRMQAAGAIEARLMSAERARQTRDERALERNARRRALQAQHEILDQLAPTHPARGAGQRPAPRVSERFHVQHGAGGGQHVDRVSGSVTAQARAVRDAAQIIACVNQALGQ